MSSTAGTSPEGAQKGGNGIPRVYELLEQLKRDRAQLDAKLGLSPASPRPQERAIALGAEARESLLERLKSERQSLDQRIRERTNTSAARNPVPGRPVSVPVSEIRESHSASPRAHDDSSIDTQHNVSAQHLPQGDSVPPLTIVPFRLGVGVSCISVLSSWLRASTDCDCHVVLISCSACYRCNATCSAGS